MFDYSVALQSLTASGTPFVSVMVIATSGSAPQDPGAKMLATTEGVYFGTVGGGLLEKNALEISQQLLIGDIEQNKQKYNLKHNTCLYNYNLADIGMTCGGSAQLFFEVYNRVEWPIAIFGAGHVAQILVPMLTKLPCHVTCFDPRKEWLDKIPETNNLRKIVVEDMSTQVKDLRRDSFVVIMTRGHDFDFEVLEACLKYQNFPYLGVMGSSKKAASLKLQLQQKNFSEEKLHSFFCPIGFDIGSNHLQEIAISIAAQLLGERDKNR